MHQRSLLGIGDPAVDRSVPIERIELDDRAWIEVGRGWLRGADSLLDALIETVEWNQGRRWMYDRMVDDPRLSRWYRRGDSLPDPALDDVGRELHARYRVPLGGPGLNYYRDGRDSVAFHRDRELRHLDDTLIAILTLGAERPFLVRPRGGGNSRNLSPASGDLLVMGGRTQRDWEHGIPKVARAGPRISATWRWSSNRGRPEHPPRRARPHRSR
ncbi:MAG: alpha-ketoglutarate-dependent dioxygenase AlkB [Acidimicrobiia bacterium]